MREVDTQTHMDREQLIAAAKRIVSAAIHQQLATVPQNELTEELLTFDYNDGRTPLFIIAMAGQLQFVPTQFLTEGNLTKRLYCGATVLHAAIIGGQLGLIPHEILTRPNLLIPDKFNDTPLFYAVIYQRLDQIPLAVLSENRNLRLGGKPLLEQLPAELRAAVDAYKASSETKKQGSR